MNTTAAKATEPPHNQDDRLAGWLRHCALFSHIPADHLRDLSARSMPLKFAKGERIFAQHSDSDCFYLTILGSVGLFLPGPQADGKLLDLISPGESFGLAAMFLQVPLPVSAKAISDCLVVKVPAEIVFTLLEADPGLAKKMLAGMALKMHRLVHDIEGYAFRTAAGRIADYLLELPRQPGETHLTLPLSKGEIAGKLLVTRETLSRVLQGWKRDRVINLRHRNIDILDAERLQQFRQFSPMGI